MKCPKCNSEVRPSKKTPGYYLCDTCRKKYPASSVIDDISDYENAAPKPSQKSSLNKNTAEGNPKSVSLSKNDAKSKPKSSSRSGSSSDSRKTAEKRTRKRSKKKSSLPKFLLLLLLLLILLIIGVFAADRLGYIDIKNPFSSKNKTENTDDPNSLPLHKTGDTAKIGDIQMKVLGYEESDGNEWASPADDNEFVFVNIEITNNSEENITVSSMASFESYYNDYQLDYSSNAFTAFATNTDKHQMDGIISKGDTLNGYLCLEVPDDWETLEIHYSPDPWPASDKIRFEIKR